MNHVTVGVYSNGYYKVNVVREEDLEEHIEFNKTFRWGRALFVDGECVHQGYISGDMVKKWTKRISEMKIDTSHDTRPYV